MNLLSQTFRKLDGAVDGLLTRRPGLASGLVRYGLLAFAALAALLVAVGAASSPPGRGQEIVYATKDGGISSIQPATGDEYPVYAPKDAGFAAAPLLNGGSRSLSFTVFGGDGGEFRGDLYGADLARGTKAGLQFARAGEAFIYGGYSGDRQWLMASRFSKDAPPNVAVLASIGAGMRFIEPESAGTPAILGPAWTAQNSLYTWRKGDGDGLSLTAYNFLEQRQAVVYETDRRVGLPSYNFESNTIVFDERPSGAPLEEAHIKAIVGTTEGEVSGMEGLNVYDPSIPVPELDYKMAVLWTDGQKTGVGLLDPNRLTFEKSGVEVEAGSRQPQVSYDGSFVATTDPDGTTVTVRRLDDGSIVRKIEGAQPPGTALEKMREVGMRVPEEAGWFVPASFTWRSFEDS